MADQEPVVFGRALADVQQGEFVWVVPIDPDDAVIEEPFDGYRVEVTRSTFWLILSLLCGSMFWVGWLVGYWAWL